MSVGVLVDAVPRDAVDEAVAACGVRERRSDGKLPAHVSAYLTLGLSLFPRTTTRRSRRRSPGRWMSFGCWDASWSAPPAGRLGWEVFAELFERTCGRVAGALEKVGTRFRRAVAEFAAASDIPVIRFGKSQR